MLKPVPNPYLHAPKPYNCLAFQTVHIPIYIGGVVTGTLGLTNFTFLGLDKLQHLLTGAQYTRHFMFRILTLGMWLIITTRKQRLFEKRLHAARLKTGLGKVLEILYQSADDETTLVAQILSDQTVVCSALTPLTVNDTK